MSHSELSPIWYGGDYNPDQWDDATLEADLDLFRQARINTVTLPVFSWAKLQPSEHRFDFGWLDRILDRLHGAGIRFCLATSTAAQPAWMCRKYPKMMPVDIQGRRRNHGKRVNFCPSSPVYRRFSTALAGRMARRYGKHPGLVLWHVANEYGTRCFCETCTKAFRLWLKVRYGTVAELNRRWNLAFWGHTVYRWDEVNAPSELNDDDRWYQPKMLDYLRFQTEANLGCYRAEYEVLKAASPGIPVTTNISGLIQSLDQRRFAPWFDVVAWDNYPQPTDPPSLVALKHSLMRGLKDGQSFLLAEQSPSQQNWQPYNVQKRPGVMRLHSYQALAHGADSVLFFQLRASVSGVEKFHGAVVGHSGRADTRVFRECAQLGRELESFGGRFTGARSDADVAVVFDWDAWWAVELSSGPSKDLKYLDQVHRWYRGLHRAGIAADVVRADADLSSYRVVVTPLLYLLKPGCASRLEAFVEGGGTLVTTAFTGLVDENDKVGTGGYPAQLRRLLGLWVEEYDALPPEASNTMRFLQPWAGLEPSYQAGLLCGVVRPETCHTLAVYGREYYQGAPCLTVNTFGAGSAYHAACDPEPAFLEAFLPEVCRRAGVRVPPAGTVPDGIEVVRRRKGRTVWNFILNHRAEPAGLSLVALLSSGPFPRTNQITGLADGPQTILPPFGVAIYEEETPSCP